MSWHDRAGGWIVALRQRVLTANDRSARLLVPVLRRTGLQTGFAPLSAALIMQEPRRETAGRDVQICAALAADRTTTVAVLRIAVSVRP